MSCVKSKLKEQLISRLRQPSIQTRLTLRYMAVLSFTLLTYAALVNVLLVWNAWSLIDRDLAAEAQEVYQLLELRPSIPLATQSAVLPDTSQSLSPDILVQVRGPDGQVVARSPNAGTLSLPNDKQAMAHALAGRPTYVTLHERRIWLRAYLLPLKEPVFRTLPRVI